MNFNELVNIYKTNVNVFCSCIPREDYFKKSETIDCINSGRACVDCIFQSNKQHELFNKVMELDSETIN